MDHNDKTKAIAELMVKQNVHFTKRHLTRPSSAA
jgi:hypothetical protein